MRILGIDPGSVVCGYGVIDVDGTRITVVEYGVVHVKRHTSSFPQRLREIHERLEAVIARTRPDEVSLEAVFHAKNVRSIVQLSQARGVAILVCAQSGHDPVEYTPMQVKRSVTGRGAASKSQVATMVRAILEIDETPEYHDATDALAVAICHAVNGGPPPPASSKKRTSTRKAWAEFVAKKR
jgi:crossover junction endodeoxyribonuclease RuvC